MVKKILLNKKKAVVVITCGLLIGLSFAINGYASSVSPGTATDPLVSQSYVDARFNQLQAQISGIVSPNANTNPSAVSIDTVSNISADQKNQIIEEVMAQLDFMYGNAMKAADQSIYVPVFASTGQYIVGGEGTEIILRSGGCTGYLGNALNGIVNATTGQEIIEGSIIEPNNILIIPRDDGRGVKLTVDSWFIIKGKYTIK